MTVVIHSVKDAVDQMLELASIVEQRVNALEASPDREAVLGDMAIVRRQLTETRPHVESLRRR